MKRDDVLIRLVVMAKPIVPWLLLGAALDVLAVIAAVLAPELLGDLTQVLYDYWEGGAVGSVLDTIAGSLVLLALVYGAGSLFSYLNMLLMNRTVTRFFTSGIRIRISEKIRFLPVSYVDQTPVGDVLQRMNDDVSVLGGSIHDIFNMLVKGFFQIVLIGVAMFREDPRLAVILVLLTPASVWLSTKIARRSERSYDQMFHTAGKLTELVEESFTNIAATKAYNLEEHMAEKHAQLNKELTEHTIKARFIDSVIQPVIRLSNSMAYILINLAGGYLAVAHGVSVGTVVTIILFSRQLAAPLEQLSFCFSRVNRVRSAARRVFHILDMEEEVRPKEKLDPQTRGEVVFSHVDFSYDPGHPLIRDLSFRVEPGRKVAIVGPTGAGKTTIVNLLMRFYDIQGGTITLDGQDTAAYSREDVRGRFAMVLQDTWLFRGTIGENVAYGKPDATRQQIEDACRRAYCDHFIRAMPDGYDTLIGEDTTNLSGGQKQLLTIARALLADKPLLILDEATSNVDTRTEILIQNAMDKLMEGRTCFVIAHRLSTIVNADLILVLDQGSIVEQGTHRQLLDRKGFYHQLYTSQYAV